MDNQTSETKIKLQTDGKLRAETYENKVQDNTKQEQLSSGFFQLFRFADNYDYIMMVLGTFGAVGLGASTPLFILFWGDFTNVFGQDNNQIVSKAFDVLLKFIYLGIGALFAGWIMISGWLITGERQANVCRKTYFSTLLRQQIGWFDSINQAELSSNFTSDTQSFQGAIGQKVAIMLHVTGTFIGGFIIAFIKGWVMTLVCLAAFPLIAIAGYMYMRSLQSKSSQFQKYYSKAGGLVEQAFFSIKTVKQLNGQTHEQKNYEDCLGQVKQNNLSFGMKIAASMAFMHSAMFLLYSLGYWFGSHCAQKGSTHCPESVSGGVYSAGNVITVFFAVLVGCFNLSQLSPALKKIAEGRQSAARIFSIIDRTPLILNPKNGIKPEKITGHIRFENVVFSYPKDKTKIILNNINIEFHLSNTALVGESGCGKSTILQLIMRFYDPDEGRILLDGIDLKQLDLIWLRNQIGYVGQQPVLFATSILQNLKLGYENATLEQINQALHQAEAYDFVHKQLENGLQTYVGSGGGQISGGQKQRIAIARALLKKPKILLLDEATSALDRRNEKLIQNTLNNVTKGITTVTVAHRIQSIMSANIIYVINRGTILQKGHFNELERYKNFVSKEQENQNDAQVEDQLKQMERKPSLKLKASQHELKIAKPKTKQEIQKQKDAQLVKEYEDGIYRRVFGYLKERKGSFAIGVILTMILGGVYPVFSIFLSDIMNALFDLGSKTQSKKASGRDSANIAALVFLILAGVNFLVTFLRDILTYIVGDEITNNIRKQAYNKLLKMPISWFDKPDNNCGILSKRLGSDCQTINGMATTYIYIMIQSLATLVTGIIIALTYEWRIALVALGFMPLVMLAGAIRTSFRNGLSKKEDEAYKQSSQIIMQSLTNIRTVVSFGVQNTVLNKYQRYIDEPQAMLTRNSAVSGFFFGLSQVITFLVFGILFYIGTIFVRDNGATLLNIFTAIYQIFFAGITVGNNSHFLPDMNEAKVAAAHIFKILDSEDEEQQQKREGSKMIKEGIKGHIRLQKVTFKYETRNQYVFKDISLQLQPSQKIAFVGPSGCGKSTILQLLQRFYEPQSGTITLDGHSIKDYDIYYLRSKLGVVSQQPVLFNGTFRQNIIYNKYDTTEQQMRDAASEANALLFIEGNQKLANKKQEETSKNNAGFDKNVGLKGSHISGGQKQRVAIARAILRNPQILLLDEATSALDAQNQKKVQQSLDQIMQVKTTITIAHRIETIKNSDAIYVFEKGEIVEKGTYESLVAMKGFFYNLQRGTQFL